jgi:ATP-dependent DNA helicase RecG
MSNNPPGSPIKGASMSEFLKNIFTKPEGKTLEFKRDSASPTLLMKTIVAFANTAGGRLVIGIGDDRQIVGLKAPLDEEERLRSMIADGITPHLVPNIELITIQETTLLVVEVFVSALRPHWLKSEGHEQGVYVRIGKSNHQADSALIAELGRSAEGISFDEMPMAELSKDDLDLVAVQKFFAGEWKLDEQALVTIKLLTSYQRRLVPTKGAILLFGKERTLHFPDAWVQCGRFNGTDKGVILDHIDIYDHLPKAVESIMQFFYKHTRRDAAIPVTILREAVINAVMHADYSQRGAPIRIAFFDDRIEIDNPGTLLAGMTLGSMQRGSSRIRNHVIARVFRELNLIERWGSGISSIFNEAEALGLPKPQIMEISKRIRVIVHFATPIPSFITQAQDKEHYTKEQAQEGGEAGVTRRAQEQQKAQGDLEVQDGVQEQAQVKGGVDAQIIGLCLTAPLSSAEIATALGHKQLSGNLRKALPRLRDAGLIEYTIPQSHNSRLQKYRITEKGKAFHLSESISAYAIKAQELTNIDSHQKAQLSGTAGEQVELLFEAQDTSDVKAQVYSRILAACSLVPLSSAEVAAALGHKQLSGNLRKALPYLRSAGLLQYTIPEKPNSRLQRYRLTAKGRALFTAEHGSDKR